MARFPQIEPEIAAHALRTDVHRMWEELAFHFGERPSLTENIAHWAAYAGFGLVGFGAILGITATIGPDLAVGTTLFGAVTTVIAGVIGPQRYQRRHDVIGQRWLRFWRSRLGKWVAKLAGVGLKRLPGGAGPAYRRTETAIGMAADGLFEDLPTPARQVLKDLAHVVWRLESQTQRMRALVTALETSLASEPDASAGELVEARDGAQQRLTESVTALESIRLQLLRLQAGTGTVEGLSANLAAAREIADAVERLLEGRREIEDALD